MHNFRLNFKKTVRDRAAEYSTKAYNHYLRFQPHIERIVYKPIRNLHEKFFNKYGKS